MTISPKPASRHPANALPKSRNLTEVAHRVTREMRQARNAHRGGVLWFTGLSGSGKSTLAMELERRLFERGYQVFVLDGDNLRTGLNRDLGFSAADRDENIRRVGEVAGLFAEAGMIVISAFISPYRDGRARAREAAGDFHEVWIQTPLEVCEERDPKGLYRKARAGEIRDFTGISAPYEPPEAPEVVVETAGRSVDDCAALLVEYVDATFKLPDVEP